MKRMIKDKTVLEIIRMDWDYARSRRDFIMRQAAFTGIGGIVPIRLMDFANNLGLVFAYSVLQEILQQLCDEKYFSSKGSSLGFLMENSKTVLPWVDFAFVNEGRKKRNDIAHKQKELPRGECWKYIEAIEKELVAWGIRKESNQSCNSQNQLN